MPIQSRRTAPSVTSVLDDLRRIVRVLRESSRSSERRIGLSGAQLFVLKALQAGEPASVNELAARTRTHQSTVSVVVGRLVGRRLIRRAPAAADRRRVELRLTARGRTLLERAPRAAQDELIAGLERMAPAHRDALARGLRRWVQAMGLGAEAPAMFFEEERRA